MANKHDLLLRLDSQFEDKGFKSAEESAKALVRELDKVERAQRNLANMQIAAQQEAEQRRAAQLAGMESVGRGLTAVGLLAAAGLGLAAKAASDWESAWAGVTKTVDGSPEQMAALESELRNLANTLPATHEEIAGVAEAAGQLGVKREDIASFTKTMIDLGESTNLSSEEAATGLAQLGNVMGVLPDKASNAGSALVALGNDGASTETDILNMSLRIAGAGRTIGLTQPQVMGFASALSSVGIEAEAGGSAISRVMVDISQAVETGGEKLDLFAEVAGMSASEFQTAFQTDAAGAVASFVEGLGRMQASGQSTFGVLDSLELSEIRVRDALLRASSAGDLLSDSIALGTSAWEENNALVVEASKRYETAESRIKIARNQLNDAAIDIGGVVLPALAAAAERVGFLADVFADLPDSAQTGIVILGSIATAAALAGGAALLLIPKLAALNAALLTMGPRGATAARGLSSVGTALTGPWGVALAGATIALGVFMEKQFEAGQRVDELAAQLDQQTGAVTRGAEAWATDALAKSGALKAAKDLGISLEDLTDASLGNADAQDRINTRLQAIRDSLAEAAQGADGAGIQYADLGKAMDIVADATAGGSEEFRKARDEVLLKAEAMGTDAAATDTAASATKDMNAEVIETKDAAEKARKEIDELIRSIEDFGGKTLSARDANREYQEAIDTATKALTDNGKTLDISTDAGRKNQAALDAMAKAALESATANFENGSSVKSVTGDVEKARTQFIDMATKMGMSDTAAAKLADQLGLTKDNVNRLSDAVNKTPASKEITFKTLGLTPAIDGVATLRWQIQNLNGKTVTVTTRLVTQESSTGGGKNKAGGTTAFGTGGYTGDGPMREEAGTVHKGEFVLTAAEVRDLGGPSGVERWRDMAVDGGPGWGDVNRRLGSVDSSGGGGAGLRDVDINAHYYGILDPERASARTIQDLAWKLASS